MEFNENEAISKYAQSIELSGIRKFYNKVIQVPDAISLTLGQPDFPVPEKVKRAMIQSIMENKTQYTENAGMIGLREEISKYLRSFDIHYSASEICVTVGGSEAILSTFTALLNPGDRIAIAEIAYPAYESCAKLLGAEVRNFKLREDFSIDLENLKILIQEERPKVLILSYPSNPTGAALSKKERDEIYALVKNEKIFIITDEIYSSLFFKEDYYSVAQIEDIRDKVILVNGFSKMFSMTGLRVGYVCAKKEYIENITKVHQYSVSCAPSISQYGVMEGLRSCMSDVEYMKNKFIERRDYVYGRLIEMGFDVNLPQGAFYIFPSIKKYNLDSETFCERLLKEAKVAIVPGSAFGEAGEGYIRLSYCYSIEELTIALDRVEKWLQENF